MWSLVVFPKSSLEEESVSLVPSSWVTKSKNECFWPPGPAAKLIKTLVKHEKHWLKVPCRVKHSGIVSYAEGRALEQEAENFTNPENLFSEAEDVGRKKQNSTARGHIGIPSHKLTLVSVSPSPSQSSADGSDSSLDPINSYSPLMSDADARNLEKELHHHASVRDVKHKFGTHVQSSQSVPVPSTSALQNAHPIGPAAPNLSALSLEAKIDLLLSRQEKLEQTVLAAIAGIKISVTELLLRTNKANSTVQSSASSRFPVAVPLKTVADFTKLTEWSRVPSNYKVLVEFCSCFGGKDGGNVTRNILVQLFAASVAQKVNWTGKNGKLSFEHNKIKDAVIEGTQSNENLTEAEKKIFKIEISIKNWFRNARDLEGGKTVRSLNDIKSKSSQEGQGGDRILGSVVGQLPSGD